MKSIKDRFYSKIEISESCWLWKGGKNKSGYGSIFLNGKKISVHRYSYELHKKKIPKNTFVLHKCDNPSCVNPRHLFLGTQKDNMQDMIKKGRKTPSIIDWSNRIHPRSKLTKEKVLKIKKLLINGKTQSSLSKLFNISISTISHINTGYSWKNL